MAVLRTKTRGWFPFFSICAKEEISIHELHISCNQAFLIPLPKPQRTSSNDIRFCVQLKKIDVCYNCTRISMQNTLVHALLLQFNASVFRTSPKLRSIHQQNDSELHVRLAHTNSNLMLSFFFNFFPVFVYMITLNAHSLSAVKPLKAFFIFLLGKKSFYLIPLQKKPSICRLNYHKNRYEHFDTTFQFSVYDSPPFICCNKCIQVFFL